MVHCLRLVNTVAIGLGIIQHKPARTGDANNPRQQFQLAPGPATNARGEIINSLTRARNFGLPDRAVRAPHRTTGWRRRRFFWPAQVSTAPPATCKPTAQPCWKPHNRRGVNLGEGLSRRYTRPGARVTRVFLLLVGLQPSA